MAYLVLKLVHILCATLFFGAGVASVFYKLRADAEQDPVALAFVHRNLVLADWIFTIPPGIGLPLTGGLMVWMTGMPWRSGWVAWGIVLYVVAGLCWLPAFYLQHRMRDAAVAAAQARQPLPPEYLRWTRIWGLLGVPSFCAAMGAMWMMVSKGAGL